MNATRKIPWSRLIQRGVLVQDRDGRIRRLGVDKRTNILEWLHAIILRISLVKRSLV